MCLRLMQPRQAVTSCCSCADEANYSELLKAEDQAEQFDDAKTDDGSWDEFLMEATQVRLQLSHLRLRQTSSL